MYVYEHYTQEALDKAYNARATVPNFEDEFRRYRDKTTRVKQALGGEFDVAYGDGEGQVLDVFPAKAKGTPVNLFIHGGYWAALTKEDCGFVAEALVPAGATVVVNSYALAPAVTLDEIVRQCRQCLAWVHAHAAEFGADPNRIYVSGHSAGGQLIGMLMAPGWHHQHDLPRDVVKGACGISGIYDLRPIRHAYVNEWLDLSEEDVLRLSPLFQMPDAACPVIVTWAEKDPSAFSVQGQAYVDALSAKAIECRHFEMGGHNHFTIVEELGQATSPLFQAVRSQMGL
ncbi:MAG: alpha/beta hydrolase [Kiloniellales bacterium]